MTQAVRISVTRAITVGLFWVNGPIFPIMFLPMGLALVIVGPSTPLGENGIIGIFALFFVGWILAWTWWSINVPRWRLWAYQRVDDIPKLKRWAVAVGLTWPDGHFLERTEIKSKAHAARERDLERQGRPR